MSLTLLQTPCHQLLSLTPKRAQLLIESGIRTLQDLLFKLPLRYEDRTILFPLRDLTPGKTCLVQGEIVAVEERFSPRRQLFVQIAQGQVVLSLRFFYYQPFQKKQLLKGKNLRCFGEVRPNYSGGLEMVHPDYQVIEKNPPPLLDKHFTAVYPSIKGISQRQWRLWVGESLHLIEQDKGELDLLPPVLREKLHLYPLQEALSLVHRPKNKKDLLALVNRTHPAQTRLAFEELLAHQLSLQQRRHQIKQQMAPTLAGLAQVVVQQVLASLPFELTGAQQRVLDEITRDLQSGRPMLRLIQGDVGAGKTLVALLAGLLMLEEGWQVAFMVPTEILAQQHAQTLAKSLSPLGKMVYLLTAKTGTKQRREIFSRLTLGEPSFIVGTHALFQKQVKLAKLGLIIIDEQHRFGVEQRLLLQQKGEDSAYLPHQLMMTATPIPRTLAMTVYADLDLSIIDALPAGRQPITTRAIPHHRREEILEKIKNICAQGEQVYWVCTLIEDSEALPAQAAETSYQFLNQQLASTKIKIGLIHGRLNTEEKDNLMQEFKANQIQILVATTVIEVGVDVPNANLIVIENPERLGLSQLHQLRGRVGRGHRPATCILLYEGPLSSESRERLGIMRETQDGFIIAEKDLRLRGSGEILGTRQTGTVNFQVADLARDKDLLPRVHALATQLLNHHPQTATAIIQRWLSRAELYGTV